jgi:large subunit ribosomal protein L11
MAKETVDVLISGGKATAAPPLGPALGPKGVNIGQVIAEINKKTASFAGMQVPVKVIIDTDTKEFSIKIGTPPAAELIKKEAGIAKASGSPKKDLVADLKIEQLIKIAGMKEDALLGNDAKARVKEIAGTCRSMGIMVEEMRVEDFIKAVNEGKYDKVIASGKTELTAEELKEMEIKKKVLAEKHKEMHDKYSTIAKDIIAKNIGKENKLIRKALHEAEIPEEVINEFAPEEKEVPGAPAKK